MVDEISPAVRRSMLKEHLYHQEAINKTSWSMPPLDPGDNAASYADMMNDPAVAYGVGLLRDAIVSGGWHLEPAGKSKGELALAEDLRKNLADINIEEALDQALDSLWRGFTVHEITWKHRSKKFFIDELATVNPDQIAFEMDDQLRIREVISKPFGMGAREQRLKREKVWLQVHRGSRIKPIGESILEPIYRAWSSKNRLLQFWGLSIQRFGMMSLKVTIPANTPPSEQTNILSTLYQGRLDGIYLLKDNYLVEEMNPTQWANLTFEKAIDYQDAEILRGILYFSSAGGAVGSTHITGTALAEQNRATTIRLKRISQALARGFTIDVIQPLCLANYRSQPEQCPRLALGQPDAATIAAIGAVLTQLVGAGITDPDTAAEQLGLPEPTIVATQPTQTNGHAPNPGQAPRPGRNGKEPVP